METFQKFVHNMNENTKQLNNIMHDYSKKQMGRKLFAYYIPGHFRQLCSQQMF